MGAMKRAEWFLNNGYSAKRTSEITGIPEDLCEVMKNGRSENRAWQGLEDEGRQAGSIRKGQERFAENRGA